MDPQTALCELLSAYNRNDRERIDELLETLKQWNLNGGFSPAITRTKDLNNLLPTGFVVFSRLADAHKFKH